MKLIISILLSILLVQSVKRDASYAISGSLVDNTGGEFKARSAGVAIFDLPLDLGSVGYFYSAEVMAANGSAQGDLIVGAIRFLTSTSPTSFLGYFAGSGTYDTSSTGLNSLDFNVSAGFIVHVCARIEERNPSGVVVRTVKLSDLAWDVTQGKNGDLSYLTLVGQNVILQDTLNSGEDIEFDFFVSNVLGTVPIGPVNAIVTPRSLESVISINNWQYLSTSNTLDIVFGVATGSESDTGSISNMIVSGSGISEVYSTFSSEASINNAKGSVSVSYSAVSNLTAVIDDLTSITALQNIYKGSISANIITVSFPAGASSIVYDPTVGAGQAYNSASSMFLCAIFLIVTLML